jgi:predicted phage tail protein
VGEQEARAMLPLTLFLAKLIGLMFLVFSLAMAVNKRAMIAAAGEMVHDHGLLLIGGSVNLAGGLAIMLGHNLWSGGALTVIITLIGWLLVVRGIVWLCAPQEKLVEYYEAVRFEKNYYVYAAIISVIGLGLTIAGYAG